ncbi:hypothetical protein [Pedobacter sp. N23S346]|uniref:hypothetical protein n=1 Tax=Pedobacter sp. N23S346 TaxID=3402750 RepID=UPI003AD25468
MAAKNSFYLKTLKKINPAVTHPQPGYVYKAVCLEEEESLTGWVTWAGMKTEKDRHEKDTGHLTSINFKKGKAEF